MFRPSSYTSIQNKIQSKKNYRQSFVCIFYVQSSGSLHFLFIRSNNPNTDKVINFGVKKVSEPNTTHNRVIVFFYGMNYCTYQCNIKTEQHIYSISNSIHLLTKTDRQTDRQTDRM